MFNKPVYVLSENELSIVRNYFYKCMQIKIFKLNETNIGYYPFYISKAIIHALPSDSRARELLKFIKSQSINTTNEKEKEFEKIVKFM